MVSETAVISQNIHGDKLYQARARAALPLLVRQAMAEKPIFYQHLADELGMPNPRNLNFVLGSVGQSLIELGREWAEEIPPIQCLVVNQSDELPGEGFGWFMPREQWKGLSKRQKAGYVRLVLQRIYAFPRWKEVLTALHLAPLESDFSKLLENAATMRAGGESDAHRELKEYIRTNPAVVGLPRRCVDGIAEKRIPSGDCIDVFFDTEQEWVGIEVKSHLSDDADIVRGLFQCVKYKAVLAAMLAVEQKELAARSILVLGRALPERLRPLKHTLGVTVIESVGCEK